MAGDDGHAGLSIDTMIDLAAKGDKIKSEYDGYKAKYDKYKMRYDQVRGLLDTDRRSDALFDLGLEGLQKLLGEFIGEVPITKLFWKSYSQYFTALKDVIMVAGVNNDVAALQAKIIDLAQTARRNADAMTKRYAIDGPLAGKFDDEAASVVLGFKLNRPLLEMADEAMHRAQPTASDKALRDSAMREVFLLYGHYRDAQRTGDECIDDLLAQWAAMAATRAGVIAAQARIKARFDALKTGKTGLRRGLGTIFDGLASRDLELAAVNGEIQDTDLGVDLEASMSVVGGHADKWAKKLDAWNEQMLAIGLAKHISSLMGG
ncbi:hypothetical protein KZX46_06930 [Polymorphobacter sp. PAMC 29334]|uniref:hypothetical protein n=1 Tax=Polymorphobacter sp. PAMC 29334 TaxID=2862331 RepID=UPI001C762532|nr:hypothetical protein [Polymorphobacter sp. PAMC 29334]QYE35700.1 hypothetical protein KZX46_06930 [Polymorphobacter sp. PAMC 29334]